ncbi:MAG: hypothetical protein VR64_07395 [Desulfatitalea sp. BRH_c12]|nr:MAG: hypothetical protein VR64_07395 [Desulfatitalea sp. BRH_c12]
MKSKITDANANLIALLKNSAIPPEQLKPIYDRHGVDIEEGAQVLVKEICLDGSNTLASILRGRKGVAYDAVVRDVAQKLEVPCDENESETSLELKILEKLISRFLEKATPKQRADIEAVLIEGSSVDGKSIGAGAMADGDLIGLVNQLGAKATADMVNKIVTMIITGQAVRQSIKQSLSLAGFAVSLLNTALVGWTLIELAGPAFRKTLPTVVEIARLRLEYGQADYENLCE